MFFKWLIHFFDDTLKKEVYLKNKTSKSINVKEPKMEHNKILNSGYLGWWGNGHFFFTFL